MISVNMLKTLPYHENVEIEKIQKNIIKNFWSKSKYWKNLKLKKKYKK